MVPPKRANFNMVSQTIFHIFTYHMPIVPPQVKQTSQRTMDLVNYPIDLSLIAQLIKSVLSSQNSISIDHHFFDEALAFIIFYKYITKLYLINSSLCKSSALSQI